MKTTKIQEQKVYVNLSDVLALQELLRLSIEQAKAADLKNVMLYRRYTSGIAQAIRTLKIPMEIPKGY